MGGLTGVAGLSGVSQVAVSAPALSVNHTLLEHEGDAK